MRLLSTSFVVIVAMITFFTVSRVSAEVFQWIDSKGIIHFYNEPPQWWDSDKNVYHSKHIVDKQQTLKKLGLATDLPDFVATEQGDGSVAVNKVGNKITYSSSQQSGNTDASSQGEGRQPKSFEELDTLTPGQVIADLAARQYHSADCRRLLRGFGKRKEYRYQLNQLKIFPSIESAEAEGFKKCPICNVKTP